MKQKTYIFKALGVFMSLFVLTTVLPRGLVKSQMLERAASSQSPSDDPNDEQAHFSELSSDVVIPSVAFDFSGDFVTIPTPDFRVLLVEAGFTAFTKPQYRISYFEKLFEHHIAINAP